MGSGNTTPRILHLGTCMELSGQSHAPAALTPRKVLGTHWTWYWMSPKAGLHAVEKRKIPCLCRESNPGPEGNETFKTTIWDIKILIRGLVSLEHTDIVHYWIQ